MSVQHSVLSIPKLQLPSRSIAHFVSIVLGLPHLSPTRRNVKQLNSYREKISTGIRVPVQKTCKQCRPVVYNIDFKNWDWEDLSRLADQFFPLLPPSPSPTSDSDVLFSAIAIKLHEVDGSVMGLEGVHPLFRLSDLCARLSRVAESDS